MLPLRIGSFTPAAPVVLAPMAGVTNRAFRTMCRTYGPDLVYVNEMVMANAVVYRNDKTQTMMQFGADESPRSLQVYGSDPDMLGRAVHQVCDEGRVDHVDINFGCPAAKVTRKGGGAAVPAKPALLRAIVRAAVRAAAPYGVPVTTKFRMGLWDDLRTDVTTGLICAEEGVAWIALHARTVEQHYSGEARWDAIAELKQAVDGIPVLGNGDIWEASDAVDMMRRTGCDGVVIGRGCLGRPWLFGDLVTVLNGGTAPAPRSLGEVRDAMARHARLLAAHYADFGGEGYAMRDFRKHTSWYLSGYPVGPAVRRALATISSLAELDDHLADLDPTLAIVEGGERIKRGHTNGPIKVALPDGYLDHLADTDYVVPDDADVMALSGG
ncbi:MAG: tRNA dihydrouridine synthase DusB [Acidimicrobiia bacterium]